MQSFTLALGAVLVLLSTPKVHSDWPTLRQSAERSGFVAADLNAPFRLAWARHFNGERLGTAMEPIIAGRQLFVATHSGSVYALQAEIGQPLWRFQAHGAFLHSPAYSNGLVVAGCTDGNLYALDAKTGALRWSFLAGEGGFSASPTVVGKSVFIGARSGEFFCIALNSGQVHWRKSLAAPIRQTAAYADGRVFVTAEDLRVHCLEAGTGSLVWSSEQLAGQTARDYYPIIARAGDHTLVMVRTNPILNMGQRIGRDRHVLCQNAGVDDSSWQKVDAWSKSEQARGSPELWAKEQAAIIKYLDEHQDARSFFVLEAATGREAVTAPVLWIAGCQGVGAEPAATADGTWLVFYRSAYGNWNHGVAPLVALGLLDLERNRITPLFHENGRQPPWNTFWGTADESQNFVVAGHLVLMVHQGTLSGFDLKTRRLFTIWGERDTYGGFRTPPWARNEWHGPGRGGVAVAGQRIYWITGSRVLCLEPGPPGPPVAPIGIEGATVITHVAPEPPSADKARMRQRLTESAAEVLANNWAPLFVDPGLAGRDFSFDDSGELFEALAWAYPHLPPSLQTDAKALLAKEWSSHPPFKKEAWHSLTEGERRNFQTSTEVLARLGQDKTHHPFGNVHAVWLYAERCGEWDRVLKAWPRLQASFNDFLKTGWRLEAAKGDLLANRYLASFMALGRIAARAGDTAMSQQAAAKADETAEALVAWWKRAADRGTLTNFKGSAELDPFIGAGDAISFRIAPHRHKVALLHDLTPEVAALVRTKAPAAVETVWNTFEILYRTWPLAGEERQVHFGENFVDPPDLAAGGFKALAWLKEAPASGLAARMDLPFCRADLHYLTKLALALEAWR